MQVAASDSGVGKEHFRRSTRGETLEGMKLLLGAAPVAAMLWTSLAGAVEVPDGNAPDEAAPGAPAPVVRPPPPPPPASAVEVDEPPAPEPPPEPTRSRRGAPPASTGFQAHFGTGASFPFGDATGRPGDSLGARYAWQVPFLIGLGAKLAERWYLGGYLQFGFGSEGSNPGVEDACDDKDSNLENDVSCSVITIRAGLEGEYSFDPAARWNPWIGYGLGIEGVVQSIDDEPHNREETNSSTGTTYAKLSFGADYRAGVGIGPFVEVVATRFEKTQTEINGYEVHSGPVEDRALHTWITFGFRMVVRP
ncbi:MAG: hypothetical protein KC766_07280 [Myxococcales bacterium]|nr:hypothetical protein [Myxococcales bacterium]